MFAMGVLVFGMVLMPVLGSLGELHVLANDPSGSHATELHGDHHAPAADSHAVAAADSAADDGQEPGPLHELLHFGYWCGQQSLTGSTLMPLLAQCASGSTLLMPDAQVVPKSAALAPFRPPITT